MFIIDTKKSCYVWIGRGTSEGEKKNAMQYAHVRINLLLLHVVVLADKVQTIYYRMSDFLSFSFSL